MDAAAAHSPKMSQVGFAEAATVNAPTARGMIDGACQATRPTITATAIVCAWCGRWCRWLVVRSVGGGGEITAATFTVLLADPRPGSVVVDPPGPTPDFGRR